MKYYSEKIASSKESQSALWSPIQRGQTLVEYALILVLVSVSFGVGLAMTTPAISAAFQNTIYGLLGQESDFREYGHPGEFWLTVTWVAENPPEPRRIPTRTLAAPTATVVTPEGEDGEGGEDGGGSTDPVATITPRPSSTPVDVPHIAPWRDTVENANWYRLGSPPYLGSADWFGEYYRTTNFTGEVIEYFNRALYGGLSHGVMKFPSPGYFTWTNSENNPLNSPDMSVRFTRTIYIAENNTPLQFYMQAGGSIQMWLIPAADPLDQSTIPDLASCGSQCIQIFNNTTSGLKTLDPVLQVVNEGFYRLHVQYVNVGSTNTPKILNLDILTIRNPDDRSLDAGGSPTGSTSQCNWGRRSTTDSNTLMNLWDQNPNADGNPTLNANPSTICYLELRGYVHVPTTIAQPQFVFWDVWDLGGQQRAWFEIGIYTPIDADSPNSLDRDAITWHRVDVHAANTLNYNWTRQVFDFDTLQTLTGENFRGQNVTFRFAFENGVGGRQRWHVDDIQIIDGTQSAQASDIGLDRTFALNTTADSAYFRTTGQWELTSNHTAPAPTGGNTGCCSWELRPGANYTTLSHLPIAPAPNANPADQNMRVHYVELLPIIDINASTVDEDGDEGPPMLSFWHGYHVGPHTALEVQYRAEGTDEWLVIPSDSGTPAGELIPLTNTTIRNDRAMRPVDVTLEHIPPSVTRYHIRFAMYIHGLNTQQQEGWWIDNIKLHREDAPRFLDYPFYDDAENGMLNWLATGDWWVTNQTAYAGNHAFTDSPTGSYQSNSTGHYMTTLYPLDLRNNTPANLTSTERPGGNTGGAAVAPYLTFWHKRELATGSYLQIEWKPVGAPESAWQMLWKYVPGSDHNGYNNVNKTLINYSWEYASISLVPVMHAIGTPSDLQADDILLRFHLRSGGTPADGWYIDNIRLEEKPVDRVYHLWENGTTPTVGGTTLPAGQGAIYTASPDDPDWQSRWRLGGDWERITWESHNGIASFHDSANGQTAPPISNETIPEEWRTRRGSYNILELTEIIDMRATPTDSLPTLYFWSRFNTASSDRLRVQISYEMPVTNINTHVSHMQSRCPSHGGTMASPQCYEQDWGWSRWLDVPASNSNSNCPTSGVSVCTSWGDNNAARTRNDGWRLWQIDLRTIRDTFNSSNVRLVQSGSNQGRRIRIRFVMDAQDSVGQARSDGWYIGDVSIEPLRVETIARLADGPFVEPVENMYNWFGEGGWGVDPAIGLAGEEQITVLGIWYETWWKGCAREFSGQSFPACASNRLNANQYPNWPTFNSMLSQRNVTNIDYYNTSPYVGNVIGRWVLETAVVGTAGVEAGTYYFTAQADDGVRMRWEEIDMAGNVVNAPYMPDPQNNLNPPNNIWNIIGSEHVEQYGNAWPYEPQKGWRSQGATLYVGHPVVLENGKRYRIILEFYDDGGDSTLRVNVRRSSAFSFSDTPRTSTDLTLPDVPPINYANTSITTIGTIDLSGSTNPQLLYSLSGKLCDASLRIEVSTNGGFTWSEVGVLWWIGNGAGQDWQQSQVSLSSYRTNAIMLRFRLDRTDRNHSDCSGINQPGLFGIWITDIVIADAGG